MYQNYSNGVILTSVFLWSRGKSLGSLWKQILQVLHYLVCAILVQAPILLLISCLRTESLKLVDQVIMKDVLTILVQNVETSFIA